ncbi:MAG: PQQ-dependent sugar dehydrogenase [Chloroflexota bacterium]
MNYRLAALILIGLLALLPNTITLHAAPTAIPPCANNIRYPRAPLTMCPETLIEYPFVQGIASITALTFGSDGSLYLARPATSEIIRLKPDSSGFLVAPYPAPQTFAAGLPEPPNGLTYYDGAWYVAGDTMIVRLRDTNNDGTADEQQIIARDLPGGAGGWLGNIRVGPDKRLYVAKGASCESCVETDLRRGALLSFALDGSDPQIVARGLHDSYDFDWSPLTGALYIVDNERPSLPAELNMIPQSNGSSSAAVPDFGWPRCDAQAQPINKIDNCTGTLKPIATFAADSHPMGVSFYRQDAFPAYKNGLLVALSGSWNAKEMAGFSLALVTFDSNGSPTVQRLLPDPQTTSPSIADASLYLLSFYPDHLTGLAVSPEGWIYLSVSEGRIYRFRPRA